MISNGKHLNSETYRIENDILKIEVLKEFGAKIASLIHKESGFEFLFQPTLKKYDNPLYGDAFYKYDTSGIDDTIPTIDICNYPNSDIVLKDHGDVWAQEWDYSIVEDSLICVVKIESLPLKLQKSIKIVGNSIQINYELFNLSNDDTMYLWAFHGLNVFNEHTEMFFSHNGEILNVIDGKNYDFDYKALKNYADKSENKFYFVDEIEKGYCGLDYVDEGLKYILEYDTDINKYLGVWITKGGFKGEYNCAIEPASGFYDSLEHSYENDRYSVVKGNDSVKWNMNITIEKY